VIFTPSSDEEPRPQKRPIFKPVPLKKVKKKRAQSPRCRTRICTRDCTRTWGL